MMKNVLIVVAHADDETLGCGGTIAKHVANGDKVQLLILADGVTSRTGSISSDSIVRNHASDEAIKIFLLLPLGNN